MTFKHITSRDNSLFKQLKKLADSSRERRKQGQTLLDGVHLVEGYLGYFGEPELLVIPEGESSNEATGLLQTLVDVPTVMFPTLMFSELTPVASPTGILALVKIPQLPPPSTVDFALLLEDIQDPANLGSIMRTAAAAGVEAVYLSTGCTDAWSPKALRGGQGAHFVLPVVERVELLEFMRDFKGQALATAMQGESLYAQDLKMPTAFLIGNEGTGLSDALLQAAHKRVNIPIAEGVESLNAAAASAICLFERVRQKLG